ncbi:TPA: hypothetical protein ACH3X1_016569 [Trebouxia sp. C0004]
MREQVLNRNLVINETGDGSCPSPRAEHQQDYYQQSLPEGSTFSNSFQRLALPEGSNSSNSHSSSPSITQQNCFLKGRQKDVHFYNTHQQYTSNISSTFSSNPSNSLSRCLSSISSSVNSTSSPRAMALANLTAEFH